MKQILTISGFAILLMLSCQRGHNSASNMAADDKITGDTLAYARLVEGFEKRFAAIEMEYDSAGAERQLELEAEYEELDQEMLEAQKQFIRKYPASNQSLKVLNEIDWSFSSASEFKIYLELLDSSLHKNSQYRKLDDLVRRMEEVEVGKQAPDFTMEDVEGTPRKLSEQYSRSKYLLLDFWALNCGPCRMENRNIVRAYERYHRQGFEVLGVSTDTRKEAWLAAIEKDGLVWTNVCSLKDWNENEVVGMYVLRQTSQNFLLDATGKILATDLRGEELLATLEVLFR
jgi:peroxiredoxin